MPNFISLVESEINNPTDWVFAQEDETRLGLEGKTTFAGTSTIPKTTETYKRSPGAAARTINGLVAGSINVVTFEKLVPHLAVAGPNGNVRLRKRSHLRKSLTKRNHPNK